MWFNSIILLLSLLNKCAIINTVTDAEVNESPMLLTVIAIAIIIMIDISNKR